MCGLLGIVFGSRPTMAWHAAAGAIDYRGTIWGGIDVGEFGILVVRLARTGDRHLPQPVKTEAGSVLALNGEIYNYKQLAERLGAHCSDELPDTVVAALWLEAKGRDGLQDLRGEFSLAFWDNTRRGLLLARDAFGSHPLFVGKSGHGLVFGSSARAVAILKDHEVRFSDSAISDFIWYGVSPLGSAVQGVESLSAGSYLWCNHTTCLHAAFQPWGAPIYPEFPIEDALRSAVYLRSSADRAALSLSGGLDSSLIAHVWPREHAYQAFTLDIESAPLETGSRPIELSSEKLSSALLELAMKAERPLTSLTSAAFSLLAKDARAASREVLLGGEGADEIFAGYHHYGSGGPGHPFLVRKHLQREVLECWLELEHGCAPSELIQEAMNEPDPAHWIKFDRSVRLPEHLMPMNSDIPSLTHGIEARTPYLDLIDYSLNGHAIRGADKLALRSAALRAGAPAPRKRGVFVSSARLGRAWFYNAVAELIDGGVTGPGIGPEQLRTIHTALEQISFVYPTPLEEAVLRLILALWSLMHGKRPPAPTLLHDRLPYALVSQRLSKLLVRSEEASFSTPEL